MVWGFPRGKPQLFTDSPRGLSNGVMVYAFGRRLPRLLQRAIALQVRVPGLRRLMTQRQPRVEPVCGRQVWQEIQEVVRRRNTALSGEWLHFSSQWDKQRSSFLGLSVEGSPELFLTIEKHDGHARALSRSAGSYRVPSCRRSFHYEGWSVREFEPLPQFHRPARWDPTRIRQVADDVSETLQLARQLDIPSHWLPMHGDLVPWNLREDKGGQLWLLDWEDAGWGPPFADVVRFIVAYHSLGWRSPHQIARHVRSSLAGEPREVLHEVAQFWLQHHNVQPGNWPRQSAMDAARKSRESAALRALAAID
jgi:thiamine kinase-like enzyme